MARLSDVYGITGPKAGKAKRSGAENPQRAAPQKLARTAGAVTPRVEAARAAVGALSPGEVKFLMKISQEMSDRLEAERQRRGLRSRAATILAVLDEGLVK